MIPLKPLSENLCICPRCRRTVTSNGIVINGMRTLLDAHCNFCHSNYYIDLPSGHGLLTPVAIDKDTEELFDLAHAEWFSVILGNSTKHKIFDHVPITFHRQRQHPRIVILNCLDYLYGHCLLKLLNAQHYLDHHSDLACCVIVPKQLMHLVPDGVAEIWEVDLPLKAFQNWYVSLEDQCRQEIEVREICYLSVAHSHPHPSRYDLQRFVKLPEEIERAVRGAPVVVFAYRGDRTWGASGLWQTHNINALFQNLKLAFPTLSFVVTGFGKHGAFAGGIVDERVQKYCIEQERHWLKLYRAADCVVGVHGSNMLLPSGLARHVVELLPEDRLGNITQDLLWPSYPIIGNEALYRVRFLPGRPDLGDVKPNLVASVIAHQLGGSKVFTSFMTASLLPALDSSGVFDTRKLTGRVPGEAAAYMQLLKDWTTRRLRRRSIRLQKRLQRGWLRLNKLMERKGAVL